MDYHYQNRVKLSEESDDDLQVPPAPKLKPI